MKLWNNLSAMGKVAVLALLLLIGYLIYKEVSGGSGGGNGSGSGSGGGGGKQWDPQPLASELYNSMDGMNTFSEIGMWGTNISWKNDARTQPWSTLASLQTDDQVKAVHNAFLDLSKGESLAQWIKDEWAAGEAEEAREDALDRLSEAGLN